MKTSELKRKLKFCKSSAENDLKIKMIKEIVDLKQNVLFLDEESDVLFDNKDLEFIVEFLSTSCQFLPKLNKVLVNNNYIVYINDKLHRNLI